MIVGSSTDATGVSRPVQWTMQGSSWSITVLTNVPGWTTYPVAVNSSGIVVGRRHSGSGWEGVVWTPGGGVTYFAGYPSDINSSGVISGDLNGKPGVWTTTDGTTWTRTDLLLPLSIDGVTPTGATATGINDANVVVGFSNVGQGERGIRWEYSGGAWSQGVVLKGGAGSWVREIGDDGKIAGGIWVTFGASSCDRRSGALWTDPALDPTLVPVPGDSNAMWEMNDVNGSGDVVGRTRGMCGSNGTPSWLNAAGSTTSLGLPKGASTGEALAVSNRGPTTRAVGYAGSSATVWSLP
jgi:hypothetical protein